MTQDETDRHYAEADGKLAVAVRSYLWEMVRISGDPQWEEDPDFALLAVARVMLKQVCYREKLKLGEGVDALLSGAIAGLADDLEDAECRSV